MISHWQRFVLVFSLAILSLSARGEEVAMFRGNPAHTGVYDGPGIAHLSGVRWMFSAGGELYSSPAAADRMIFIGSTNGNLYAIRQETGTQVWKFETKGRIVSSPAVVAGLVYFNSYDSTFYAVDEFTGQLKWKFSTNGELRFAAKHIHGMDPAPELMPDPFDFFLSSPVVANGVVYFGSGDHYVYAVDAATGALKWKFRTGDVVHATPAFADNVLYVGSWDSYFYALNANTGKQLWRFKTGEDQAIHNQIGIQSSAAVSEGIVYFGCRDSNLYSLDARHGEKKWVYNNKGSWVIGSPAVQGGRVYFATSDSGLLHAVDAKSGANVFSAATKWPMFSSPALAGNMLYIGSHEGKLFAIDISHKNLAWTFQTEGSKRNGSIYTKKDGSPDYDAAMASSFYDDVVTGIHKMFTAGAILASPIVVNNTVYFGSTDGNVYALY